MINRERFTIPCTDGLAPGDLILWREDVHVGGWPGQEAKCMGHRWNSGMVFWANWDAARAEVIYRLLVFRSETDCAVLRDAVPTAGGQVGRVQTTRIWKWGRFR